MEATTPAYPTRLSDAQWATLAAYFAADSPLGRPRKTHLRAVVEAILYVLRAGCPWRMLPGAIGDTGCSSGSWSSSTACWKYWSGPEAVFSEWSPGVG